MFPDRIDVNVDDDTIVALMAAILYAGVSARSVVHEGGFESAVESARELLAEARRTS